jgi:hypothetical protein
MQEVKSELEMFMYYQANKAKIEARYQRNLESFMNYLMTTPPHLIKPISFAEYVLCGVDN